MSEEILYIVSDYVQWQEYTDLKKNPKRRTQNISVFKYLPYFSSESSISNEPTWTFCIGGNGQVLSIVQQTTLEMRTEKHYNKIIAKATLPDLITDDYYPSKRVLAWSPDCSIFAIATTHGDIACYDLLASNLFVIESQNHKSTHKQPTNNNYAKELVFLDLRTRSSKWSYELILIGGNGSLISYAVSPVYGYQIQHTFNFMQILGTSLLLSVTSCLDPPYMIISSDKQNKLDLNDSGLNLWSMISYEPYYNPVVPSNIKEYSFLTKLVNILLSKKNKYIIKMSLSPSSTMLACLYGSKTVSILNFPEINVCDNWFVNDQQEQGGIVDIAWWSNEFLILGCLDGTLIICRENGQQSIVNAKMNPFYFKLCGSYNCDNFMVVDYETVESYNNSQDSIVNAKGTTTNLYKLIAITKTTPQQLLSKKIQEKQYEDALLLASKYNLNKDLVYKHQWCNSLVSKETINNILSKVSDKQWIVNECCNRVSESLVGAKLLISYGLEITDFSEFLNIESENTNTFSQKGKNFIISRLKLLNYLDKLTTYEMILNKMENGTSEFLYSAHTYKHLRDLSPLHWALQLARQCQVNAVSIVITYYSNHVLPYWLDILNDFPETLMPKLYRHLLPVWNSSDKQVVLIESNILRELDWCESDRFKLLTGTFESIKSVTLTENDLIYWYTKRIRDIESRTKLVQHALEMATIARENNIKGLEQLHEDLSILEVLVYEVYLENIFLKDIEQFNTLEKASLFMSKCDSNMFLNNLTSYFLPYIQTKKDTFYLLEKYLIQTSKNSLKELSQFFRYVQINGWCIKVSDEAKVDLGLKCIYTYTNIDQLDEAQSIILSLLKSVKNTTENKSSIKQLENTSQIINASKLLLCYGIRHPLKMLFDNLTNDAFFRKIMLSICECTSKKNQTQKYWSNVLEDMLKIAEFCFPSLSISICYEVYATILLTCQNENIMLFSKDILLNCLEKDLSLKIVKDAFIMYFDQSKTFNDKSMTLAKLCLKIFPNEDFLVHEWNLISAMTIFNTFGIKLLPIQVRQCKDKWKLIDLVISYKPKNYTLLKKIIILSNKLNITSLENFISVESNILFKCATAAYEVNDLKFASKKCIQLMEKNESLAWKLCVKLGTHDEIVDINLKINMLSFAVMNCPVDNIVSIIELRKSLENENTEQIFDNDSKVDLPQIKNINFLAVSNYESSIHLNCSNCVEVCLSHEEMLSNLKEMIEVSYRHLDYDKVLSIYGFKYLGYDSKMAILCFLYISKDSIVDECFNCCEGILSTKLALYIYTLRYAFQFMDNIDFLKIPSDQLIKQVMSDIDAQSSESQSEIEQYLRKYALLHSKYMKGVDSNVSAEEMNKELIRMAETGQVNHLEKALEICNRQSLQINDKLLLKFLKSCINKMPARNVEEVLMNIELNGLIHDNEQFYNNLILEIYDDIPGTNHNILIAYYTTLNCIYPNNYLQCKNNMTPTQHIKLLKRVHSTIPDIDYKLLLNSETAYETFSIAEQTGYSTPVLNRLLKSLPEKIQHCIKFTRSLSSASDVQQDNIDFNKLIDNIESPVDIDKIVKLLSQANDVNEVWVKVFKRLLVFEPQDFRVSISILKYTYSKHNFNKEELEDIGSTPNANRVLLSLLYLLFGESAMEAVAISYFQTNYDVPDLVLDTILEYGIVEQLVECEEMMNNLTRRALVGNSGKNCQLVCEQLASSGRNILAGSLHLTHNGVPVALRTNVAAREISESYLGRNIKDK